MGSLKELFGQKFLANSAVQVARVGLKMKPELAGIQLSSPTGFYIAGSRIDGALIVRLPATASVTSLKVMLVGEALTKWVNKISDVVYESKLFLINEIQDLGAFVQQISGSNFLPEGTHTIPFSFSLPPTIPSSIFNKDLGWVIYSIIASFATEGSSEVNSTKSLTVFSLVNILSFPLLRNPVMKSDSVERISCFRSGGVVQAAMSLPKAGFVSGETITVHLEILNKTRKKRHPTLTLSQHLEFKAENQFYPGEYDKKEVTYTVEAMEIEGVQARATESYKGSVNVKTPTDLLPSSVNPSLIEIKYFLKFNIDLFELILPICIGNAPNNSHTNPSYPM